MSASVNELPPDTIYLIFEFLTLKEVFTLSQMSIRCELSVVARSNRVWKSIFSSFSSKSREISANEQKTLEKIEIYFEKYKYLKFLNFNSHGFCYSHEIGTWVEKGKRYVIKDLKLQRQLYKDSYKVVFVGDGFVGKTSLAFRLMNSKAINEYLPTVLEYYVLEKHFFDRNVKFHIWDVVNQEDRNEERFYSYPDCDVFVVCLSLSQRSSFMNMKWWMDEISRYKKKMNVSVVLCLTKIDLRKDPKFLGELELNLEKDPNHYSMLKLEEILEVAKTFEIECFVETSSKEGILCDSSDGGRGLLSSIIFSNIIKQSPEKEDKRKCVIT